MIFINNSVRLKAKFLSHGKIIRLFFISLTSFIVRWGLISTIAVAALLLRKHGFYNSLTAAIGPALSYPLLMAVFLVTTTLVLCAVSGIRMGERLVYLVCADGCNGRFATLFRFINVKKAFHAFCLYSYLGFFKLIWLLYFTIPVAICSVCVYYLYAYSNVSMSILLPLLTGTTILVSTTLVMWRVSVIRYDAAVYYMCLQDISVKRAVKKSIAFIDGTLCKGILLEYSLLGWILSCIFVIPLLYCIPYIKLCKAVFINEAVSRRATQHSPCAINYLQVSI